MWTLTCRGAACQWRCISTMASGEGQFQAWDWKGVRTADEQPVEVESRVGRLVLFLSETPHAVAPITHGPDRRAMFVWLACMELERNEKERQLCS